jgi:hypothetical protein
MGARNEDRDIIPIRRGPRKLRFTKRALAALSDRLAAR